MADEGIEARPRNVLASLLGAELGSGIFGLRLFITCVSVATLMLGIVWILGNGLSGALERNGLRMLGGDLAVEMPTAPLDPITVKALENLGEVARTVELRTSGRANDIRAPVELKAVDSAYPLYGSVRLETDEPLQDALSVRNGIPGAVVDPALLSRFKATAGDNIALGETVFEIRGTLVTEPDRLASGRFLVGPRIIIADSALEGTGLTGRGSLAEYRYRLRVAPGSDRAAIAVAVGQLEPDRGWELQTPADAGDRVRRTVDRTTTFLGAAGIVALAIGLAGAWAAATVWIARRARTIALYRLSGATPGLVIALHAVIIAIAGTLAVILGLGLALSAAFLLMDIVVTQLHLVWDASAFAKPAANVAATLLLGLVGAASAALSAAGRIAPGSAMRSGDATLAPRANHVAAGLGIITLAIALAVFSLPVPVLGAVAALGLAAAAGLLGLGGWLISRYAARKRPNRFIGIVAMQGLAVPGAAATKALAIGIGIAGISAVVAAQGSLETALRAELPERIPDLVLIDVQPDQVAPLRQRIESDDALGGLQATPFLRASILAVNGVPAEEALVRPNKSWVIEGDRSFSWAAEPTGAELLAGEWWPADYDGPPLISAEEDVFEAFDLKPGDRMTYSVLGRPFTSEVVNIRKEYHRTFRPEFLLVGSPTPFRDAPHSWILSLQGASDDAVDTLITDLAATAPNVTSIDIRQIVAQVTEVIDGAILGTLAIAATMLFAGGLTLAAVVAADVDARRREALAFTLVGASRLEIALARLAEAVGIGAIAALLGGLSGNAGGYWLVHEALHVAWAPGILPLYLPVLLGVLAAITAAIAGGLSGLPRGRGQVVRYLAN